MPRWSYVTNHQCQLDKFTVGRFSCQSRVLIFVITFAKDKMADNGVPLVFCDTLSKNYWIKTVSQALRSILIYRLDRGRSVTRKSPRGRTGYGTFTGGNTIFVPAQRKRAYRPPRQGFPTSNLLGHLFSLFSNSFQIQSETFLVLLKCSCIFWSCNAFGRDFRLGLVLCYLT